MSGDVLGGACGRRGRWPLLAQKIQKIRCEFCFSEEIEVAIVHDVSASDTMVDSSSARLVGGAGRRVTLLFRLTILYMLCIKVQTALGITIRMVQMGKSLAKKPRKWELHIVNIQNF